MAPLANNDYPPAIADNRPIIYCSLFLSTIIVNHSDDPYHENKVQSVLSSEVIMYQRTQATSLVIFRNYIVDHRLSTIIVHPTVQLCQDLPRASEWC